MIHIGRHIDPQSHPNDDECQIRTLDLLVSNFQRGQKDQTPMENLVQVAKSI